MMGRKLREKQLSNAAGSTENSQGSCVWGMLHIMKYHHWHHVTKRLGHKKRGNSKNADPAGVGNRGNYDDPGSFRNVEDNDAKLDRTTNAEEKVNRSSPTSKTSTKGLMKSRIIARISDEIAKRSRHNRNASCPVRSLTRTESIHHCESPSAIDPIAEMVLNEPSPRHVSHENKNITFFEEPRSSSSVKSYSTEKSIKDTTADHVSFNKTQNDEAFSQEQLDNEIVHDMLDKKLIHVKELDADSSGHQEYLEALDIINVNKEFLVKMLHDPGSPLVHHFQNQQAVSAKMSLTKAESFPMLGGKEGSNPTMRKLKTKHELKDGSLALTPKWSASLKYASERPPSSISDHINECPSSSADPSLESRGGNPVAIKRFKDLRHKIRHVIKESKHESQRMISMDAVLHKIPRGKKLTRELVHEVVSHSKDPALLKEGKDSPRSRNGCDHSSDHIKKTKMRRTSSCDASLDRYRKLYETTSFKKEAKCQPSPERLQVRAQDSGSPFQTSSSPKVPKSLGRIYSLPDMESYYQGEESSDGFPSGTLFKNSTDENARKKNQLSEQKIEHYEGSETELQLDIDVENEFQENLDDAIDTNVVTSTKAEPRSAPQAETCSEVPIDELEKSIDDNSVADASSSPRCSHSEAEEMELKNEQGPDDLEHKQLKETDIDFHTEVVETHEKYSRYDLNQVQVEERDMIEFNYVKDVLESSGFNNLIGTWHADDYPPVCPSVYEGFEGCFVLDPDCVGNKKGGECDHLLLFDLINEVLLEISGRSYNYCPHALSSLCHIRLMPAGHRVLKEVWTLISWYLSLRPEFDRSLDCVVSNDLAKNDGWMNLQYDSECIGIELEDLIFDQLLEEIIWD